MQPNRPHFYAIFVFCILGFVSGLPYALVTSTFQAWLSMSSISVQSLGWLGLVTMPYALKPLWAFGIDWLRHQRRVPLSYCYIVVACALAVVFYLIARCQNPSHWQTIALVVTAAVLSATTDICVDAMRICFVDKAYQGLVTSWFVICYRVAFVLSGGLGLVFAKFYGWHALYSIMAVTLLLSCMAGYIGVSRLLVPAANESQQGQSLPSKHAHNTLKQLLTWFQTARSQVLSLLVFLFLFKFHGIFLGSLLQVFLLRETGMTLAFIGLAQKTVGMLATFLGGIVGGLLSRYYSHAFGVRLTVLLQGLATLILLSIAMGAVSPTQGIVAMAMYMESFCLGISTTFVTVLITRRCDVRLAATQYALFTAIIDWERTLVSPISAWVQSSYGWPGYFMVSLMMMPFVWLFVSRHAVSTAVTQSNPVAI